ncbi:MAG: ribonuclease D [Alphaproteobacteria bacterium]|nr:ribonuclease D [Alphaproteobacteria bacterium]
MFGDTPLVMVEDDASLARVCAELSTQDVLAVDTESDSFHHYQEKVCLIQLSGASADYIVDPLTIDDLSPLKALLEDPDTRKILHGADYDVVCLKRDFDIALVNIFDTMIAGQFLAFPRIGLADLILRFFGEKIDKQYQRHDWSARPLEDEHVQYARGDTHWLIALAEVLQHKLDQLGLGDAHREECRILAQREWTGREAHPADFLRVKQAGALSDAGKRVLRTVWEYREEQARRLDRPAFKVIPGNVLIDLAKRQPTELDDLAAIVRERSSTYRRHGEALLQAVAAGLADERPLPELTRAPKKKPRRGPTNDQLMASLRTWRNELTEREGLSPVVVASNELLKDIAAAEPATLEELAEVRGVRDWQVEQYGPDIVAMVQAEREARAARSNRKKRRRRRRRRSDEGAAAQGE